MAVPFPLSTPFGRDRDVCSTADCDAARDMWRVRPRPAVTRRRLQVPAAKKGQWTGRGSRVINRSRVRGSQRLGNCLHCYKKLVGNASRCPVVLQAPMRCQWRHQWLDEGALASLVAA